MLTVYLTTGPLSASIEAGAGIVGENDDPAERTLVYYQPRTPAVNIITFADRVFHAADRLRHQAATSKLCLLPHSGLVALGYFDETEGRVVLTAPRAQAQLARWLGQTQLDSSELECQGAEHFARRRELLTAMRGPNPGLASWARSQARRHGLTV